MSDKKPELPPELKSRLASFQQKLEEAESLRKQGRPEEAYSAYQDCLGVLPVYFVDQLAFIMLSMGFCYADKQNWDKALDTYHHLERILVAVGNVPSIAKATPEGENLILDPDVQKLLPEGVECLLVADNYDPTLHLANLYDSIALAYDNSNRVQKAMNYYQQAIETYMELGQKERATRTWRYMTVGCRRRQDWENLQHAAENMLVLCTELENLSGKIDSWRLLMQAHTNQDHREKALEYLRTLVAAEESIGHPALEEDRKLLKMLQDVLRKDRYTEIEKGSLKNNSALSPAIFLRILPRVVRGFLRTLPKGATNPAVYAEQAHNHIHAGRYKKALAASNRALELDPDYVLALLVRSNAYIRLSRYEAALVDANRAVQLEPNDSHTYFSRGIVYEQLQRFDDALADYNRSIELDPLLSPAYNNRGTMYTIRGEDDKALADFYRALEIEPDHPNANFNIGSHLHSNFELTKALQYLERAERQGHNLAAQLVEEVRNMVNSPDWDEALEKAAQVLLEFAYSQCGSAMEDNGELRWSVDFEPQHLITKSGYEGAQWAAVLDLHQTPGTIIGVTATSSEYKVSISREKRFPEVQEKEWQTGWLSVFSETVPADPDSLLDLLGNFLAKGVLVKSGRRLLCTVERTVEAEESKSELGQ